MVHAIDAALEDREIAFDGVSVRVATDIFLDRVIDRSVARKGCPDLGIDWGLIRAEMRVLRDSFYQDRFKRLCRNIRHMARANLATALYQRHDRFVARQSFCVRTVFRLAANVGFVRLYELAFATHRLRKMCLTHTLADTVRHEPCSPI